MEKGLAILVHSVRQVFGNMAAAVRISGVLFAVIAVISVLGTPADPASAGSNLGLLLILAIVSVLISLWIAVAWHRYVLLREGGNTPLPAFRGDAIGRYFVNGLLIALIMIPIAVVLGIAAATLFSEDLFNSATTEQWFGAFMAFGLIVYLPIMVVFYRLAAILPAAALGKPLPLGAAWAATRGETVAMLVLALSSVVATGVVSIASWALPSILGLAVGILGQWALTMVGASVLTTIYGHYMEKRDLVV